MQWSDDANAGFSDPGAETWLPVNSNYQEVNVEAEQGDPSSHLAVYRATARLRRDAAGFQVFCEESRARYFLTEQEQFFNLRGKYSPNPHVITKNH